MNNDPKIRTKKTLYILIAIVTLALAILIILFNYYFVYSNVNRIDKVATATAPNVEQVGRIACSFIRDGAVIKLLTSSDALAKAQERCKVVM